MITFPLQNTTYLVLDLISISFTVLILSIHLIRVQKAGNRYGDSRLFLNMDSIDMAHTEKIITG